MGVALTSLKGIPAYGIRYPPANGTNGWYIWAGEYSSAGDFFQPVCAEHAPDLFAIAVPFLALPPGWAFITDGSYIDVWYDPKYLNVA